MVLGALILGGGLGVATIASAAGGPQPEVYSPYAQQYFSPDGDGGQDRVSVYYCLSGPASVDVTVTNSAGTTIRKIETGVSKPGSASCSSYNNSFSWDGKTEAGATAPDGLYTAKIHAVDAAGQTGDTTATIGIDTRLPGKLTTPAPGDKLSGTVSWVFTPTAGFTLTRVHVACDQSAGSYDTTPGAGGTYSGTVDTTTCTPGANHLTATASWTDAFGDAHSWQSPATAVTVTNAAKIVVYSPYAQQYFSPDGDGGQDRVSVYYCLSGPASVDVTVTNSAGTTIRKIETGVSKPGSASCSSYNNSFSWDGKTEAGATAPDGLYTAKIHAVDAAGQTGDTTATIGIDTRLPGKLTTPAPGDKLSGTVSWVFTPTAGFTLTRVHVACDQSAGSYDTTPGAGGTYSGTVDTTTCTPGANHLTATASWTDAFGDAHSWQSPATAVTVTNAAKIVVYSPYAQQYFSPDGDGGQDRVSVYYCLSGPASVDVTVTNSAGTTIRKIETGVSKPGSASCSSYNNSFSWDGKTEAGATAPDGLYTAKIHAVDAAGQTGDTTATIGIDTRLPGKLTTPAPGDKLSGTVSWVFTPTAGFTLTRVHVACDQSAGSYDTTPGAGGTYSGTVDTTTCTPGANHLTATASWTDAFGDAHSWQSPATAVTVTNAAKIVVYSPYAQQYFSPDGDGGQDRVSVYYCLSGPASVDVTVTNSAGTTIRKIETGVSKPGSASCSSYNNSFSWDGKTEAGATAPDGLYTAKIHAVDAAGQTGDTTATIGIDTRLPGKLTTPAPGDKLSGLAVLAFAPTTGFVPSRIEVCANVCATIYGASPDGVWRTSILSGTLTSGAVVLHTTVSWTDQFGDPHSRNLPDTPVVVDNISLPLVVTTDISSGAAPLATVLSLSTSEPLGRSVHYGVDFGDGTAPVSGELADPYPAVKLAHTFARPGAYRTVVTVTNSAGASSVKQLDISVTGGSNSAPTAGLDLTPVRGVGPLTVQAGISGTDPENDPLTYGMNFGDGTAEQSGSLPHGQLSHTYSKVGTYTARLSVGDGKLTTIETATVVVTAASPLSAKAGDDQVVEVGAAVHFDGSGSLPQAGIGSFRWNFGDGGNADSAIADHTFTAPGTYTAHLTVTAGDESKSDAVIITVKPIAASGGLVVSVSDGSASVGQASLVVIDPAGNRYSAVTDTSGKGHLVGLPDGSFTVYGWKSGYLPATGTATVLNGGGTATVKLESGQVATTELTSTPMTYDQILSAGIDPAAPENQHVYQVTANIALDSDTSFTFNAYTGEDSFSSCPKVDGKSITCGPGGGGYAYFTTGGGAGAGGGGYGVAVSVQTVNNVPQMVWLVIPLKASWLKEFFDVRLMVSNLGGSPFTLEHGAASLSLPAGLSLAPTSVPQKLDVDVPNVAGGTSSTTSWLVRGDTEGYYDLSTSYAATLAPFDAPVAIKAATSKPLHVWGGSALTMTVDVDETASQAYPYDAQVSLKNVADVPVYNPAVEALMDGAVNLIYQPRERLVQSTAEIKPGETFTAKYLLVPTVSGRVNLDRSFIQKTAGDATLASKIIAHSTSQPPGSAPRLSVDTSGRKKVKLTWEPVQGATSYAIYSTPTPETMFGDTPVATVPGDVLTTTVKQDAGTRAFFGISPIVNGVPFMRHPLTAATATLGSPPKITITDVNGNVLPKVMDVAGGAKAIRVRVSDADTGSDPNDPALTPPTLSFAQDLTLDDVDDYSPTRCTQVEAGLDCVVDAGTYQANLDFTAKDGDGHVALKTEYVGAQYVALGDSYSSGEGAVVDYPLAGPGRIEFFDADGTSTDVDGNRCHRSHYAYSERLAREHAPGVPGRFVFHACSGDVTQHMLINGQPGRNQNTKEPKRQNTWLNPHTTLVTLTIGGNDVDFPGVLTDCLFKGFGWPFVGDSNPCEVKNGAKVATAIRDVQTQLAEVYTEVQAQAPNAEIYVLGYPAFFPNGGSWKCPAVGIGVTPMDQTWINNEIRAMDEGIQKVIKESNTGRLHYVDAYSAFQGHEACTSTPMLNALMLVGGINVPTDLPFDLDRNGTMAYSFHPTVSGQQKFEDLLRAEMAKQGTGTTVIHQDENVVRSLMVDKGLPFLSFHLLWPGSKVATTLTSPSGRVIDAATIADDVTHDATGTSESFKILKPEAGEWKVSSLGVDIAPGGEALRLVSETIAPANVEPVAKAVVSETAAVAGTSIAFDASGSTDSDGGSLSYLWDFGDKSQALTAKAEHTYTAAGTFTPNVAVTDGQGGRRTFTLPAVTVSPPPTPIAGEQTIGTDYNTAVAVKLVGTIASGDLSFAVATAPAHGTLSGSGATRIYTPAAGYSGQDSFTFTASANGATSPPATVRLFVGDKVDTAPEATPLKISTVRETGVAVKLAGTDADNDALTFVVASNPAHGTLSGTAPNLTYTPADGYLGTDSFTYTATGNGQTSAPATVTVTVLDKAAAPAAPTGATAVRGDGAATVSWIAPTSGGSQITGYTVTAAPGGQQAKVNGTSTSATITGLTNGTAYTFAVIATNDVGPSPASVPSGAVTPAGKPGTTTNLTAVRSNGSATVKWAAVPANGAAITAYVVTATPGGAQVTVPGDVTTALVAGLNNGTSYTFAVTAVNEIGFGATSTPSAAVTPSGAPGAPIAVKAVAAAESATVSWTAPTSNGAGITQYTVTSVPGGRSVTVPGSSTGATVTGLTNATAYTFTVTAANDAGSGPASAPSAAVTPAAAPQARPTVVLRSGPDALTTSTSASLRFTIASTEYGSAKLTASCSVDGGAARTCTARMDLKNLSDGRHQVVVRAADPAGHTSLPLTVTWVVDTADPTVELAPRDRYSLDELVHMAWTGRDPGGSGAASYDVRYRTITPDRDLRGYTAPDGLSGTPSTSADVRLAAGNEYCFSVRATDQAGNVGDWSDERCVARPLDDRALTASGGWTRAGDAAAFGQTLTTATKQGATLSRTVRGNRLSLIARTCPGCGTVAVYNGNQRIATVDLASAATKNQVLIPVATSARVASRAITIVVTSRDRSVAIDGLLWSAT